jgi:hypothetical protein
MVLLQAAALLAGRKQPVKSSEFIIFYLLYNSHLTLYLKENLAAETRHIFAVRKKQQVSSNSNAAFLEVHQNKCSIISCN